MSENSLDISVVGEEVEETNTPSFNDLLEEAGLGILNESGRKYAGHRKQLLNVYNELRRDFSGEDLKSRYLDYLRKVKAIPEDRSIDLLTSGHGRKALRVLESEAKEFNAYENNPNYKLVRIMITTSDSAINYHIDGLEKLITDQNDGTSEVRFYKKVNPSENLEE